MIDLETKEKLLKEIEKSGNVSLSCMKVGIDKATFYRWKEDKEFRKKANEAVKRGRESNCDLAEHALMLNVKDKKMEAIKYVLSHQSKIYKPKDRKVFLVHSNTNSSEKAVEMRKKSDIRTYSAGYTDAMKVYLEDKREEFKRYNTEEDVLERVEEVRSGKADLDEVIMEEARKYYAKENPGILEEDNAQSDPEANKIILDLPEDDGE